MSKLALDGGTPVHDSRQRPWPKWPPVTKENLQVQERSFREVYLSATEGIPQPRGRQFARQYCKYLGVSHGLLTTSGTSALKLALCAVTDSDGLGYNGECIVPNYTFIASAHAAWEMSFSVRFVDVEPESACLNPDALEAAITPKTRVIMPVDILGYPADMDRILAVARKHNLKVVADVCQAHGACYKGKKCGSMGDAGCFSFQSTKNLTCGEGGFVATNSADVYNRAYTLHNVGRPPSGVSFDGPRAGYNYRPSEYLAVLLENRLKELDAQCERRNRAARYLNNELNGITGIRPAKVAYYVTNHAWHLYPMRYIPSAFGGRSRDEFIRALQAEGIPCSPGYTDLQSRHPVTQAVKKRHPELVAENPCPNTERICAESIWLSQQILLADEQDLTDIPEAIRKIQKAFHA
ncbi:MAG: DegT/DnrJ/EryC1/StrS family aminotransferase [Planctomycetota bacterium]|nr:MAG: DegT/DnrJ/EryC1/StrS family aminotransferase [Planctomycetota bacterium]